MRPSSLDYKESMRAAELLMKRKLVELNVFEYRLTQSFYLRYEEATKYNALNPDCQTTNARIAQSLIDAVLSTGSAPKYDLGIMVKFLSCLYEIQPDFQRRRLKKRRKGTDIRQLNLSLPDAE